MRVLIVGCRGTGIEIAKNLALQGAGGITLVDPVPAQTPDLGSNFFLSPKDVTNGVPRAFACAPHLQELNPICEVSAGEALTDTLITSHSALVVTQGTDLSELTRMDELCRNILE